MNRLSATILFFLLLFAIFVHSAPRDVDRPSRPLKIAFLTDIHVTPHNLQDSLLRLAVAEINSSSYDLVIVAGDLTNTGSDRELANVHTTLSALHTRKFIISGNHETTWSESACRRFPKLFGNDGRLSMRVGGYLFVGFQAGPYMKMADGTIRNEDLAWVERTMSRARGRERIVSVCHYPLDASITNCRDITATIKRHNVVFDLCGHEHKLSLLNFDSIPAIMGRALVDKSRYGYTRLDIVGDSVYVYEKIIGEAPNLKFALPQGYSPSVAALSPRPTSGIAIDYAKSEAQSILRDRASIYTGVACGDKMIFYGNSLGEIVAYDTSTNRELWRYNTHSAIYSTPLYHNGSVIIGTTTEGVISLDAINGHRKWRVPTATPVIGDGIIADGYLYIGLGSGSFAKIDTADGRVVWCYNYGQGHAQGRAVIEGNRVVFGAWNCHLYCLDTVDGRLHWRWNNGNNVTLYSPGHIVPQISDGTVFIVAPDRYMTAIDLKLGRQLWRVARRKVRETLGKSEDKRSILVKTMEGEMTCVEASVSEYKERWTTDAGWGYDHNPCPIAVRDQVAYMANRTGEVAAIDSCGRLLWRAKLGNSAVNDFTLDNDGNLWVSLIEGRIFRIPR